MPFMFRNSEAGLAPLLLSLAFVPFEKANGLIQPILFLGWTLNYEMFFYCIFALSLTIGSAVNRYAAVSLVMIALVVFGVLAQPENVLARFYMNPIILEFVAGMWIGCLARRIRLSPGALRVGVIGTLGFVSLGLLLSAEFLWPAAPRIIGLGLPAAVLVAAAVSLETIGFRSKNSFVIEQGNSSYALYLTHFVAYQVGEKIVFKLLAPQDLVSRLLAFACAVAIAGLVAWIVHRRIEIPLTQWARFLLEGGKRQPQLRL